jgi:hypothetical protein
VGIGPFEDFRVELYSVGQVVVQVRVRLLDTGERLTRRDRMERWPHHIQTQVHEDPKSEKAIQESGERHKGNDILHPHAEEEDSAADREQHNATL